MPINIAAMVFMLPMFVFAFFPIATPVTVQSINWAVLMFGGVVILAAAYYALEGRKSYTSPAVYVKRDEYSI